MNELERNLISDGFGAPPSHILQAIDDEMAHRHFPEIPHSIYEEVWHMAFWLELTLDWVSGTPTCYPEHSSLTFPSSFTESWHELRERFFLGIEAAALLAGEAEGLDAVIARPERHSTETPSQSIRELLEGIATHNAYHFGRIVLLRQLFGAWPPPSGGDTW
jgi:uncharacterized damage-inducible protein DinB